MTAPDSLPAGPARAIVRRISLRVGAERSVASGASVKGATSIPLYPAAAAKSQAFASDQSPKVSLQIA